MASDSEEDGLEELEFEGEYDEDDNVLIDAQGEATEDGDEVCMCSGF
jgi:transcriptional activator SPT8